MATAVINPSPSFRHRPLPPQQPSSTAAAGSSPSSSSSPPSASATPSSAPWPRPPAHLSPLSAHSSAGTSSRPTVGAPPPSDAATTVITTPHDSPAASTTSLTCDACYRRRSRCAMNESVNKCYSCDFHRQDCTFTLSSQLGKRKLDDASVDSADTSKRPTRESTAPADLSQARLPITSQHIGLTTELEPLLLDYLTLDHNNESLLATSRVRKFTDEGNFMRMPDGPPAGPELSVSLEGVDSCVAPFGTALVEKYFQSVHPTFPVLHEDSFRQCYNARRGLSPALLAAVYLVALKFLDQGSGAPSLRKPDAVRLESVACKLLNESLAVPSVPALQAGLLLSQKSTLFSPSLLTQLVVVGFDLGLHQDCSNWKLQDWEKAMRKRLAWALYVQDKWSAFTHGRPSHIFAPNWTVRPLTAKDFEEDARSAHTQDEENLDKGSTGPLIFREFVNLTCILSDILDTFYTLHAANDFAAAGDNCTRMILERAKPVQIRLKDWFARLPAQVKMDSSMNNEGSASSGGLHLAYFATEITLHRCIIRSIGPNTADPYLTHICRSAAKTRLISAMDLVNRLRPAHLRSFWPSAARTNFALIGSFGILLRITADTCEEEDFYRTRLGEYRWTLSVNCRDAEFLVFAIDSLDVATSLLRNAPPKPELRDFMARSPSATPPPQQQQQQHQQSQRQRQRQSRTNGRSNGVRFQDEEDAEADPGVEDGADITNNTSAGSSRRRPVRRNTVSSIPTTSGAESPTASVVSSVVSAPGNQGV